MVPFLYSPLPMLLGIRPGAKVSLINPPADFLERLGPLPEGVEFLSKAATGLDVIMLFTSDKVELLERLPGLARSMAVTGKIWALWPRAKEGLSRNALSEDFVRLAALEMGLVDDKRYDLDETWVGLRLVWRPRRPRPDKPKSTPLPA